MKQIYPCLRRMWIHLVYLHSLDLEVRAIIKHDYDYIWSDIFWPKKEKIDRNEKNFVTIVLITSFYIKFHFLVLWFDEYSNS